MDLQARASFLSVSAQTAALVRFDAAGNPSIATSESSDDFDGASGHVRLQRFCSTFGAQDVHRLLLRDSIGSSEQLSPAWLAQQFKQVVWKLAGMERRILLGAVQLLHGWRDDSRATQEALRFGGSVAQLESNRNMTDFVAVGAGDAALRLQVVA